MILTLTMKVSVGLKYISLKGIIVVNIKIKYTKKSQKIWRNLLKYWQKSVILCQFLASVTLTFKRLFLSLFLKNVLLCNIFLKEKAYYNLNKKIAFKTLYEFPIFNQKNI